MKMLILAFAFALTCFAAQVKDHLRVEFELRFAENSPATGLLEVTFENQKYYLHEKAVITNNDVVDAMAVEGIREGEFDIQITISPEAAANLSKATKERIGKIMAVLLNGEIKSAATLNSELSSNSMILTGNFTREQAERLADAIKSK